ncbi:MAG TPA: FAD-binding oxidoreductase [Candidatus Saccharimonadales bacterium]|nr:FAD-binding oxidoreductase [Candidatus Saccharimonadales bacterium]
MDLKKLTTLFQGHVITPGSEEYDSTRQLFYGGVDKKPAVIIEVANTADVVRAIKLTKEQGLPLAVRSGGHSAAGLSSVDGGVVVDLRSIKDVAINDEEATVWAGAGITAGELTNQLDAHDFVLGFGDTGSVGIGGITLGGGVGFLARKFGLAIDNLIAAEIVTANGDVLQVNKDSHPELFWALRGGGGNFGIVTRFQYRLHTLTECYGGMLFLPATPEVVTKCAQLADEAPNELSIIANVMPAFPMPMIPKEYHGTLSLMILAVYAGNPHDGEIALAPFRALAQPIADMLKPMRYKDIFMPEDANYHPTALSRNMFIDTIDRKTASEAIHYLETIEAPVKAFQFRVLGGATEQIEDDATAYAHRKRKIMVNIACFYQSETEIPEKQRWIDAFAASIRQGDDDAYVNFLGTSEQDRLEDAYPAATLTRLKKVKAQYDPDNFFKLNVNITPEA